MASKKKVKRRVSGPTQAEDARARKQVLVRLTAEELADVDAVAARWEVPRSDAIARMAHETRQRQSNGQEG